ncbi:MAG: hypothetical protein NT062_39225, partial [Proteobacteria bacterium]|nr:hypothetical protein [Pseudomonadota bacterium]
TAPLEPARTYPLTLVLTPAKSQAALAALIEPRASAARFVIAPLHAGRASKLLIAGVTTFATTKFPIDPTRITIVK